MRGIYTYVFLLLILSLVLSFFLKEHSERRLYHERRPNTQEKISIMLSKSSHSHNTPWYYLFHGSLPPRKLEITLRVLLVGYCVKRARRPLRIGKIPIKKERAFYQTKMSSISKYFRLDPLKSKKIEAIFILAADTVISKFYDDDDTYYRHHSLKGLSMCQRREAFLHIKVTYV